MHLIKKINLKKIHDSLFAEHWDIFTIDEVSTAYVDDTKQHRVTGRLGCWMTLQDCTSKKDRPIAVVSFNFTFDQATTAEWTSHRAAIFANLMESRMEPDAPDPERDQWVKNGSIGEPAGEMVSGLEQNIYTCGTVGEKIYFQDAELIL